MSRSRLPPLSMAQRGAPQGCRETHLVPSWLKGPSLLRHVWAGLRMRFARRYSRQTLHAHCTSGNGLMARLSGRPYIVTTYGSEVFGARERGWLYAWMIRQVLTHAERITATSQQMADVLRQEYHIPEERIHLFSLGYDESIFSPR